MTIPTLNPATGEYELPDHSGGLFGLTDPGMMNCVNPEYTLCYYFLSDVLPYIPIIIAVLLVILLTTVVYFVEG